VEIPGLTRQSILVSARGPFPALLDFLRRLEKLNVLVVQSDLRLLMEESKPAQGVAPTQTVVLKVLLSLYGRPTPAAPSGPAAAVPGAPVAAPPLAGIAAAAAATSLRTVSSRPMFTNNSLFPIGRFCMTTAER
jgi:type IV pilus assembly protein PilO